MQLVQLVLLAMVWAVSLAVPAADTGIEFKFTPFVGDPKQDQVDTVQGLARVYLNGVLVAEQDVSAKAVPVLFEAREIAPAVWITAASFGPSLRKGRNTVRVAFTPADAAQRYRAQLRWATVTDQVTEESTGSQTRATNQANEGVEDRAGQGPLALERAFDAPFATERPWHKYPPVADLSADDRRALAAWVQARADAFKPDFGPLYAVLEAKGGIDVAAVKRAKCLDKVHAAGLRIAAPPPDQLDIHASGNPEVVLRSKAGELFRPQDPSVLDRITDPAIQECAGMALYLLYPPRLLVVRSPAGRWEAAE